MACWPEDYWDARNFCYGVKVGSFKHQFNVHGVKGKTPITAGNFNLVRRAFGEWVGKSVAALSGGEDVVLVPVPSKDGIVGAATYRTLVMINEALKGTRLAGRVSGDLRWKRKLDKAHEGGTRSRMLLTPLLSADPSLKGKKVVLVDDLITTGSSMLASADVLKAAGATVLGAVVCGKTIYDLDTKHFGEQEFDLTAELADWKG